MNNIDEIYSAKAREMLALYRNGDITYDEFFSMKAKLLDLSSINKLLKESNSQVTAANIVTSVTDILSVVK